ncbi:hypothetical protein GCM10011571_35350 [Marinithermofilum abyssi]|uniref:Uncharacterized protein n=1 Tax=Marinithermofilum abyssi TaxID=1571185 RepID=A0A8J2VHD2_9BACL|nr:hypothetical protein [Marinithermofilum abyssi]GGE30091.1 hypothetical protein GCM10011571_35350 [Marinithermofilum abyssi]
MSKKTSRSVSFQMDDVSERYMLEFFEQNNIKFSPFVKRLIWNYIHENKEKNVYELPKAGQM